MGKSIVVQIVTLSLIFLFTYAGVTKLSDYQKFVVQIGQSPLLTSMADFVAWFIPALEIATVLLLSFVGTRLWGLYVSFALMVSFTFYIILITKYSDYVPCSCGGVLDELSWREHLVFNIGFVILTIIAVVLYPLPDKVSIKTQYR